MVAARFEWTEPDPDAPGLEIIDSGDAWRDRLFYLAQRWNLSADEEEEWRDLALRVALGMKAPKERTRKRDREKQMAIFSDYVELAEQGEPHSEIVARLMDKWSLEDRTIRRNIPPAPKT